MPTDSALDTILREVMVAKSAFSRIPAAVTRCHHETSMVVVFIS